MLCIITLTEGGHKLAKSLAEKIDADVYFKPKPFKDTVHRLYKEYDQLLFIMATGIVVRTLAPLLEHKSKDPAILVMDEKAVHCISLLSGHLGGANEWTLKIANLAGADPVITTASDVNNLISIDMLAEKHHLILEDFEGAKDVTALLVDKKKVMVDGIEIKESGYYKSEGEGIVYVSHRKKDYHMPSVQLIRKNLIVGMGCRRDTPFSKLKDFVLDIFEKEGLNTKAIIGISSAWVKADEKGLIELSEFFNVPFIIREKDEISSVTELFDKSEFVYKTLGVYNVAEPSGYLSSNKGKCIVNKVKHEGMTLSVWEKNI